MDYLIAPTLFQNKTCRLPGIGTLSVISKTAETDFVNTQIKAPVFSIIFTAAQDDENVFNEFTALSELIKKDLGEQRRVTLKGIGDFIKNEAGDIQFLPGQTNPYFTPPVTAKRVIRQDAEHAMLVGDKETTNTVMAGYFVEEENIKPKDNWWMRAIILGCIGVAVIVMYVLLSGFNLLGNVIGVQ